MRTSTLLRASAGAALLVALGIAAAGCGGSSTGAAATGPGTGTTAAPGGARTAFAEYESCLSAHGVSLDRFRPAGNGTPPQGGSGTKRRRPGGFGNLSPAQRQKFEAAQTACRMLLPAGFRNGGGFFGRGRGADGQAAAAFRNCLKLHGVTLSQGFGFRRETGAQRARVRKALTACAALRPARPGGGAPTPPTTTG